MQLRYYIRFNIFNKNELIKIKIDSKKSRTFFDDKDMVIPLSLLINKVADV